MYKWVDADGKTHYGSQPPPAKQDAEPLKLQSNNGSTGSGGKNSGNSTSKSAAAKTEHNPNGTKKVSKDVEEFADGLKKALGTVDGKEVPLHCGTAVGNIHSQADSMLEVGQKTCATAT